MRLSLLIALLGLTFSHWSQYPVHKWVKTYAGSSSEVVDLIKSDQWGNIYVAGHGDGIIDLDPGNGVLNAGQTGTNTCFISKLNGNGDLQWAISYTQSAITDFFIGIGGELYITGWFTGVVDFDHGSGTFSLSSTLPGDTGIYQAPYVLKLASDGTFKHAAGIASTNAGGTLLSDATDQSGNLYWTFGFKGICDLDPGASVQTFTSQGSYGDLGLMKLSSNLQMQWVKQLKNSNHGAVISHLFLDNQNNLCMGGNVWEGSVDVDPGPGITVIVSNDPYPAQHLFIASFDLSGNLLWGKQMVGTSSTSFLTGLSKTKSGSSVFTAGIRGTVDVDPGQGVLTLTSSTVSMYIVGRVNPTGDLVWHDTIPLSSKLKVFSDSICLYNFFQGSHDLDPGNSVFPVSSAGLSDIFIVGLDTMASFGWGFSFGGAANDAIYSLAFTGPGELYAGGSFGSTIDFDPGAVTTTATAAIKIDGFVSKFTPCKGFPVNLSNPFVCAGEVATLSASGSSLVAWYGSATSTSAIGAGTTFVTGTLSQGTHTYYAQTPGCKSLMIPFIAIAISTPTLYVPVSVSICAGQFATLTVSGAPAVQWTGGPTTTSYVVNPTVTTTYIVTGTNSATGCSSSKAVQVTVDKCLTLHEESVGSLLIFPNPSRGLVNIDSPISSEIQIYSLAGNLVLETQVQNGVNTLDLSSFPPGIYLLKCESIPYKILIETR